MRKQDIDNTADILDSCDIIARIEELEEEREGYAEDVTEKKDALNEAAELVEDNAEDEADIETAQEAHKDAVAALADWDADNASELKALRALADEAEGYADDWRHGVQLIRESYFVDAMRESCEDCGDVSKDIPSYIVIDWDATAENLKADYTEVDFNGVTYYVR